METLLLLIGIILLAVLTGILNRLRGTGVIKHFCTIKGVKISLVWNHVYGLYFGLVFGLMSGSVWIGVAAVVAYLVGESKGWGEWVGALTTDDVKDEKWLQKQYDDNEGVGFPYVHQIADTLVAEQIYGTLEERVKQYDRYARVALALRGMIWFMPMIVIAVWAGLLSLVAGLLAVVGVGIGFPVACWLGKKIKYRRKFGVLEFRQGWENQEVVYGLIQFMVVVLPILVGA